MAIVCDSRQAGLMQPAGQASEDVVAVAVATNPDRETVWPSSILRYIATTTTIVDADTQKRC